MSLSGLIALVKWYSVFIVTYCGVCEPAWRYIRPHYSLIYSTHNGDDAPLKRSYIIVLNGHREAKQCYSARHEVSTFLKTTY